MKLRNTAIAAALSLVPIGQPLLVGTGAILTSAGVMLSVPQRVNAESADFYFNQGVDKFEFGDFSGAISDFNKAIEINPKDFEVYSIRGIAKKNLEDYSARAPPEHFQG